MKHIVILPGWQQDHTAWRKVVASLSTQGRKNTVINLPGFGEEPYQENLISLADIVTWTINKLKTEVAEQSIILCGHSYGGRVALSVAASGEVSLAGLILIGSPNIYRPSLLTSCKKILVFLLRPFSFLIPEGVRRILRSPDYEHARGTDLARLFSSVIDCDQTDILKSTVLPVALIWGVHDREVPLKVAKEMLTLLPNAALTVIDDAGHNVHIEKPGLLVAKILEYADGF